MIPQQFRAEADRLPTALRALLDAELAAGNEIVEVASCFPAPPAGVYFMLAHPVSTRPRASSDEVAFYHRNSSQYAGEFHDERRFFFILEAPLPPPPEPDMDAIRASLALGARVSDAELRGATRAEDRPGSADREPARSPSLKRFLDSMALDYEKWREGTSYDLDAIDSATPDERASIESTLIAHATRGWREIEALARLGSERAMEAMREAMRRGDAEVRAAVVRYAPELVDEVTRTDSLVRGLREATFFHGLSEMLDQASTFHPPAVVDTLFSEALHGAGDKAVHLAALLFHIHGLTDQRFDWSHRPFFLRFNTADRAERRAAFDELCQRVGVDAARYP